MSNLTLENVNQVDWNKGGDGLIPAIVQHVHTGQVLMMGYMNDAALIETFDSQKVTFLSRKTQELWTKGETSGNFLAFISAELDCDRDTMLIQAVPKGPTCHTGDFTCFNDNQNDGVSFLNQLSDVIASRKEDDPKESYTASLFAEGLSRMCQKVGEEGVEVSLAGMKQDKEELLNESADLIFHLMVLLENSDLSISDVVNILQKRHKI
jgi:phosphoribosyl-ATP pyrophosphohydrolase/phosphoribosyl-AMP cyclohydrolase